MRTVVARWPGLNPESLWYDDLVWASIAWLPDLGTMLDLPAHGPPAFFLLLRASRAVFRDPEWSLQLVPFLCGIAAIPVMSIVAWRLTKSPSLSVLGAALTALNPLLAHYSLFVKHTRWTSWSPPCCSPWEPPCFAATFLTRAGSGGWLLAPGSPSASRSRRSSPARRSWRSGRGAAGKRRGTGAR